MKKSVSINSDEKDESRLLDMVERKEYSMEEKIWRMN